MAPIPATGKSVRTAALPLALALVAEEDVAVARAAVM